MNLLEAILPQDLSDKHLVLHVRNRHWRDHAVYLSEDPGPHAVFFSCVRRAGRGGGISRMVVVVVVD